MCVVSYCGIVDVVVVQPRAGGIYLNGSTHNVFVIKSINSKMCGIEINLTVNILVYNYLYIYHVITILIL